MLEEKEFYMKITLHPVVSCGKLVKNKSGSKNFRNRLVSVLLIAFGVGSYNVLD